MRALLVALLFLLSGCASDEPAPDTIELPDIHGIAIDPTDASVLYVATHSGLLRLVDEAQWSHVGTARDDYMGFAPHPSDPNVFWASGHPRTGGNLGVIRSTDGGQTWERIGLEGVDFHAMAVSAAEPQRLYGGWRGQVLRSDDGGHKWGPVKPLSPTGFATHPRDPEVVYAATGRSVHRSDDGATSWQEISTIPALGVAVDPASPDVLYVGTSEDVYRSNDGGQRWTALGLPTKASYAYFATHAATPGLLYVASYQAGIYKSVDSGATWSTVREPSR